jgi:serine/threonine protein kinase
MRPPNKNVVEVLDYGFTDEEGLRVPFCIMRYYPKTLRTLIKERISPEKVLGFFAQMLDGVEAAHLKGIWHRDLKPENVLYDPENDTLVVADFGIARFREEFLATQVETAAGDRLANFLYAAPEQKNGGADADLRCDIFALGLILNEMFTNDVAQGENSPLVGDVAPNYRFLDQIVQKMISHKAEERYDSIDLLKQDLMEHAAGIFERKRLDDSTKEVVPLDVPEDPYVRTLERILTGKRADAPGETILPDPLE